MAAGQVHSLAHAQQPEAACGLTRIEAGTVIGHPDPDLALLLDHLDDGPDRMAVPDRVVERLLDQPVDGVLEQGFVAARGSDRRAGIGDSVRGPEVDKQVDFHPGARETLDQRAECCLDSEFIEGRRSQVGDQAAELDDGLVDSVDRLIEDRRNRAHCRASTGAGKQYAESGQVLEGFVVQFAGPAAPFLLGGLDRQPHPLGRRGSGVVDRDRDPFGEDHHRLDVSVIEGARVLLGQVEVAPGFAANLHRNAEEGFHRRVARGKTLRTRMQAHVVEDQRFRLLDQQPEHPSTVGRMADLVAQLCVDSPGQELFEFRPAGVEHSEGRVPGTGQFAGGLEGVGDYRLGI